MSTYTTKQGDMWDIVARTQLGSSSYTGQLLMANASLSGYYTFPAGIELVIPDIDKTEAVSSPPWKEVSG